MTSGCPDDRRRVGVGGPAARRSLSARGRRRPQRCLPLAAAALIAVASLLSLRGATFAAPRGATARSPARAGPTAAAAGWAGIEVRAPAIHGELLALRSEVDLERAVMDAADSGRLLVVTYHASWCRACHKLLSQVRRIASQDEYRDIVFATMDFQYGRDLVKAKGVMRFPFTEIYSEGDVRQQWTGSNKDRLLERVESEMVSLPVSVGAEMAYA